MNNDYNIAYLNYISSEQLENFCENWNSSESRDKTALIADKKHNYHKGHSSCHVLTNGWTIFTEEHDNRILLCDRKNIECLEGDADMILGLLVNIAYTNQAIEEIPQRDYGLVLSGGGAKGAFEIGVWRWLESTGLIHKITGISGTSVGALNSLLFSYSTLKEAEEIWCSIHQEDLTPINVPAVKKIMGTLIPIFQMPALIGSVSLSGIRKLLAGKLVRDMLLLESHAVFKQEKLSGIVNQVVREQRAGKQILFSCLARLNLRKQKELPAEGILQTLYNADYYCLNGRTKSEINKIVLASAALPVVYGPITINNIKYMDGGCRDNTPFMPLVKSGFKKLIVVHLSEPKENSPAVEKIGNSELFHVYPNNEGNALGTIHISKNITEAWMNSGEQAASEQLGRFMNNGELVFS